MSSEWRPIESAPMDGTPFLAFGNGFMTNCHIIVEPEQTVTKRYGIFKRKRRTFTEKGGAYLRMSLPDGASLCMRSNWQPTHWLPLPTATPPINWPPSEEKTGGV